MIGQKAQEMLSSTTDDCKKLGRSAAIKNEVVEIFVDIVIALEQKLKTDPYSILGKLLKCCFVVEQQVACLDETTLEEHYHHFLSDFPSKNLDISHLDSVQNRVFLKQIRISSAILAQLIKQQDKQYEISAFLPKQKMLIEEGLSEIAFSTYHAFCLLTDIGNEQILDF